MIFKLNAVEVKVFTAGVLLGVKSVFASTVNLWPQMPLDIQKLVDQNRIEEARALQMEMTQRTESITKHGDPTSSIKCLMKVITGVDVGPPRPPLKALTEEQIAIIQKQVNLTYQRKT